MLHMYKYALCNNYAYLSIAVIIFSSYSECLLTLSLRSGLRLSDHFGIKMTQSSKDLEELQSCPLSLLL